MKIKNVQICASYGIDVAACYSEVHAYEKLVELLSDRLLHVQRFAEQQCNWRPELHQLPTNSAKMETKQSRIITEPYSVWQCNFCGSQWKQWKETGGWSLHDFKKMPCERCDNAPDFLSNIHCVADQNDDLIASLMPHEQQQPWKCKANRSADPPQDCDWPFCGCDPYADKVLEAASYEYQRNRKKEIRECEYIVRTAPDLLQNSTFDGAAAKIRDTFPDVFMEK